MKAAPFAIACPETLTDAREALNNDPDARVIAGGQSLAPMMALRLARPTTLVPVANLPELAGAAENATHVTLGAATTHAAIADGRTPDVGEKILARIAGGIAYRAVRNRGTIGGSLCHADPAADWLCTLLALDAALLVAGRLVRLEHFVRGAFAVALAPGEIVTAIQIPRPSPTARWGYVKACRKPGEFAHAMAAVLRDGPRSRAVIGATGGAPLLLTGDMTPDAAQAKLRDSGLDAVACHMQGVTLQRALDQAA